MVITVMASYCCLKLFYPKLDLGNFAELITALIAFFAFVITLLEYLLSKDAKQAQVLSEYNKRYSEDPNIIKVVKYLNYIDVNGTMNNPPREKPSNYEVEMFMRFIEELELQIHCGRLNEKDVSDLFVYYAKMINENGELRRHLGVTDYEENWNRYKKLIERIKKQ